MVRERRETEILIYAWYDAGEARKGKRTSRGDKGELMADSNDVYEVSPSPRFFELGALPEALHGVGRCKRLEKGERITSSDGEWPGCYYVSRGLIGARCIDGEGAEALTFLLSEGTLFLEANALEGVTLAKSDTVSAFVTECDSEVLFFPKAEFQRLMRSDAETANFVACSVAQKMLAFRFLYNEVRSHGITWRIANLLAAFAENHGVEVGDRVKLDYPISQQLLAKMLGANRITITKGVKRLKEQGLVEKTDDFYYIVDVEELQRFLRVFQ